MILAGGDVGIRELMELCHRILDGKGMPEDRATCVAIPIYKEKEDIMNCGMHRGVKLLEHAMKIVEEILEKRLRIIVTIGGMQFGFMPGKGTIDAVIILRRIYEEYIAKQRKLCMCFVDLERAINNVQRKVVKLAMRKKDIPEALVTAVMSQYNDKGESRNTFI